MNLLPFSNLACLNEFCCFSLNILFLFSLIIFSSSVCNSDKLTVEASPPIILWFSFI